MWFYNLNFPSECIIISFLATERSSPTFFIYRLLFSTFESRFFNREKRERHETVKEFYRKPWQE